MLNIGQKSHVSKDKVEAIINMRSKRDDVPLPVGRVIDGAKERGQLYNATQGKKPRSVVVMSSGQLILSAISADSLSARFKGESL